MFAVHLTVVLQDPCGEFGVLLQLIEDACLAVEQTGEMIARLGLHIFVRALLQYGAEQFLSGHRSGACDLDARRPQLLAVHVVFR